MTTEPVPGASNPQEYQGLRLRQSVRKIREGKEFAKAFEVKITGGPGPRLENIYDSASFILSGLEVENEHYIDRKYREIEDYIGISYDELKERHSEGFRKFLKQQYRLFKKEQPSEVKLLEDDNYVKDLATGYSFDFIRTLTLAKKMNITSSVALDLAEYAYWNNPNILLFLSKKFPDADPGLIVRATTSYPTNPDAFIEKVLDLIPVLQSKFPDADTALVNQAAVHNPTNPDAFIEKVLESIPILQAKFPDADPSLISRAAISYPTNPKAFIEKVLDLIPVLQSKFPDVDIGIIKRVARTHFKNPERFLKGYTNRLQELREVHSGDNISPWLLDKSAYSLTPEAALEKLLGGEELDEEIDEMSLEEVNL